MRLKGLFWILTTLLLTILAVVTYYVFYTSSIRMFFAVEALVLLTIIYLFVFYRRIIKPLHIIGNGMELLKEQDFSSRLGKVGQTEADRVVDVFNKMMEQLKNERLHLREQNHFLDLLVNASPMGVIILNLDEEILSMNPAACKLFGAQSSEDMVGKRFLQLDSPLAEELVRVPMYQAQTVRLNDANIYKCTHSSFVDRGFHHQFYLIETLTQEVFKAEKKAYEKGPLGAIRAQREFGIDDADVINAIGCHVFGRMNMTKLDKILYVADKAEFTRTYEGVDKLRDMAKEDLNGAVLMTMNNSIGHLLARGIEPTDESLMIRQAIKRETENNKGDIK